MNEKGIRQTNLLKQHTYYYSLLRPYTLCPTAYINSTGSFENLYSPQYAR